MNPNEPKPLRIFRMIAATLLAIESGLLLPVAVTLMIFITLLGGISMLAGAGGATDHQIKQGWLMILGIVLVPFIVVGMIALSSVYLFLRKRPLVVAIVCGLAAVAKVAAIWFIVHEPPSHIQEYTPLVAAGLFVSLSGLAVAILMMTQASMNVESSAGVA